MLPGLAIHGLSRVIRNQPTETKPYTLQKFVGYYICSSLFWLCSMFLLLIHGFTLLGGIMLTPTLVGWCFTTQLLDQR